MISPGIYKNIKDRVIKDGLLEGQGKTKVQSVLDIVEMFVAPENNDQTIAYKERTNIRNRDAYVGPTKSEDSPEEVNETRLSEIRKGVKVRTEAESRKADGSRSPIG